jgi:flagellar hook assembly protein FlgD
MPTDTWTPIQSLTPTPGTGFWVSRNVYCPEKEPTGVEIGLHLSVSGPCFLRVYNTAGEKVNTLHFETDAVAPENVTVYWDGTNDKKQKVASGVYILHFVSLFETRTAKLLVVR